MQRRTLLPAICTAALGPAIVWSKSTERIRRSATNPAARADLDAFGRATALMLQNSNAADPRSWLYWANVHGVTAGTSIPQSLRAVWDSCDHEQHFLAWHRLYLVYFESVVSELSGKPDFAMPYWDWFASIDIPPAFTTPGDPSNPLWRRNRRYSNRYGVSPEVLRENEYSDFNGQSFFDPHSPIHLNFGGEMNNPATAARDPAFWPHHVGMDRVWEIWRSFSTTNKNPEPNSRWASHTFKFLAGPEGERAVSTVLDVVELGYKYDSLEISTKEVLAESLPPKPKRIETGRSINRETEAMPSMRVISQKPRTLLRGDALTVRLPVPKSAASALEIAGTTGADSLRLRLSDVRLTREGEQKGVLYNIYVNLPAKPDGSGPTRHRIGQINSFALRRHGQPHGSHGAGSGSTVEFSITRLIPDLKAASRWDPNMVEVDFVEPSGEQSTKPLITIGQLELLSGRQ